MVVGSQKLLTIYEEDDGDRDQDGKRIYGFYGPNERLATFSPIIAS